MTEATKPVATGPHPTDKHVGHQIRCARQLRQLTQKQLGDAVGCKFQQIQKYETGANRVSASRLFDIAAELKVPVHAFFEGLEGSDRPGLPDVNPKLIETSAMLMTLDAPDRTAVSMLVKRLSGVSRISIERDAA